MNAPHPNASGVAAWVYGEPIHTSEVETRLETLRSSSFGPRLAPIDTAEGRNARRWVTQLLCAERLVLRTLAEEGIPVSARPFPLAIDRALALGGVAAAVLAAIPELGLWARTWSRPVDESELRSYYERNPDQYAEHGVGYRAARSEIITTLQQASADRAIATWLDQQLARNVALADGYEHPADPSHADATHRH
jgi:[acyl-carrier-protein] S-malonyltransferase